ncbi:oligosaccharyl transferase subunit ost3/OST6 [Dissophora globulifera]|uniref:Oligosaccharyl transferase subunit ost3/OST6 n=1 Tax=Dissophora globulifera TaxID=979702 RepID=A0A9P6UXN6_9FUNG|nr:oligosaccharyl transferase subunit ost3/OST6 [Dissophora globulifera]
MGVIHRISLLSLVLFLAVFFSTSLLLSSPFTADAQPQTTADLLEKKVARLQGKATKNKGIIELDSAAFEDVMAKPRNYSMAVLFTAIGPEFQCVPCLNFDPEYKLVAAGWSKLSDKSRLFFGVLDFKAGQAVFQKFGMNSAPSVLYFPPSDSISSVPSLDRYDFAKKYGLIRSFTIFIMISGHMWNQIRNPPYSIPGRDGRSGYIAQGFQNQFGLETQLVGVMYAVLTGSVISLISVVPRIENPTVQRVVVWVSMGLFAFMFSVLIQFFRVKNPGYPFTLMFK